MLEIPHLGRPQGQARLHCLDLLHGEMEGSFTALRAREGVSTFTEVTADTVSLLSLHDLGQ